MNRNKTNFWLDFISMLTFLALVETGIIIRYLLPPGSGHGPGGGPGKTIFGWNRHGWGSLHWWLAVVFAGLMVLHVVLHWRWTLHTAGMIMNRKGQHTSTIAQSKTLVWGLVFALTVVIILAGFLLFAQQSIHGTSVPH